MSESQSSSESSESQSSSESESSASGSSSESASSESGSSSESEPSVPSSSESESEEECDWQIYPCQFVWTGSEWYLVSWEGDFDCAKFCDHGVEAQDGCEPPPREGAFPGETAFGSDGRCCCGPMPPGDVEDPEPMGQAMLELREEREATLKEIMLEKLYINLTEQGVVFSIDDSGLLKIDSETELHEDTLKTIERNKEFLLEYLKSKPKNKQSRNTQKHNQMIVDFIETCAKSGIVFLLTSENELDVVTNNSIPTELEKMIQSKKSEIVSYLVKENTYEKQITDTEGIGDLVLKEFPWMNSVGCACRDYIHIMNKWGASECGRKRNTLATWIHKAAKRSKKDISIENIENVILSAIREHQKHVDVWPFVWTYWAGGARGDELKYSIRSLLHWYPEAQVYVVGDKPEWYNGPHINSPRIKKRPHHAFVDCYTKLHLAATQVPQFVWMMDDLYWVKDFAISEATSPKYVRHVSQQRFYNWKPGNAWAKTRANAYRWLIENNLPTYDFAGHLPQPIQAATFQQMEARLHLFENYKNWECIYFNMFYSGQAIDYGRRFTRIVKTTPEIKPKFPLLNHIDSQFRGSVEEYLASHFSLPCKYEN